MRVEPSNGDARMPDAPTQKEPGEELSDSDDLRSSENAGNINQRNMRGGKRDSDFAAGEAHRKIVYSAAVGKEFGLAGKGKARSMQPFLRDWTGDNRLDFSGPGQRHRFLERLKGMLCRSKPRFAWSKGIARADDYIIDPLRQE